jgi:hypothetical protein
MVNANSVSYVVDCEGMKYKYALHSTKRDRVIFPSQILNILEYCIFKKAKDGWKWDLTEDGFKFDVEMYRGVDPAGEWDGKAEFVSAIRSLLVQYYGNIPEDKLSKNN